METMSAPLLARAFDDARAVQAELHGKTLNPFDVAVGRVVLQGSKLAMADVAGSCTDKVFRVVSAPTGSGKSTGAAAVISAALGVIPGFSCAYVVETIRQADEIGLLIGQLIGNDNVTVWTSAHDDRLDQDGRTEAEAEHGTLHMPPCSRASLVSSRVIVVTHALWKGEMTGTVDQGVRRYRGRRRSILFVDEHPDLVRLIERTPGDLLKLRDRIFQVEPDHRYLPALEAIIKHADEAFTSPGTTYSPVTLTTCLEAHEFYDLPSMRPFVDRGLIEGEARAQAADMEETCKFIVAAAKGCVFISRSPYPSLVAYEVEFEPGPGHVLLDATADITGMVGLMEGMAEVDVPTVDFGHLEVFHLEQPRKFKFIPEVVKRQRTAEPYAAWVREQVIEHTQTGEDVLVVVHKGLLDHGYLERAEDPDHPVDWEGRTINLIHWGVGVGSNKYKFKTSVFLFSEFHVPRKKTIGEVHGWTDDRPTKSSLTDASQAVPKGQFLTAYEGHLLRWTKQLACRGNVRNIDAEGRCGAMKLYTSMDFTRLIKGIRKLFPGCKAPTPIIPEKSTGKVSKLDRLCKLLATSTETVLWSDAIARKTGVEARHLTRVVRTTPKVAQAMDVYGWSLASAKDLGKPGKRRALARLAA